MKNTLPVFFALLLLCSCDMENGNGKFPLSDLDSGIVNENPYPYYCMDKYMNNFPKGYIPDRYINMVGIMPPLPLAKLEARPKALTLP